MNIWLVIESFSMKRCLVVQVCKKKSQRRKHRLRRMKAATSRTRDSVADILSLPHDVLLHMLKGLHIKDLLNLRSVSVSVINASLETYEVTTSKSFLSHLKSK